MLAVGRLWPSGDDDDDEDGDDDAGDGDGVDKWADDDDHCKSTIMMTTFFL